jgi:hypothetical protein
VIASTALKLAVAGALLPCLAGCDDEAAPPAAHATTFSGPTSVPSAAVAAEDRAGQIVHDPDATIVGVRIDLRPGADLVTSAWVLNGRTATTTSDDGFATSTLAMVDRRERFLPLGPPRPAGAPKNGSCAEVQGGIDLCSDFHEGRFSLRWTSDAGTTWSGHAFAQPPLLCGAQTSLRAGTFASVCGGDGATLLPYELALRSATSGKTWQSFELPLFDGQRAYVSGSVVTSDGRLLSLLDNFSDDRPNRPSATHHGLYVSVRSNWSSYSVFEPRFSPPLAQTREGWSPLRGLSAQVEPDPVIFATTWDDRVYISTDDAATFQETPVR